MVSEKQFSEAAERYLDTLYRVALNCLRVPADAEDAVQETMLRFWRTESVFDSGEHLRNWLIRVCVNVCRDMSRSWWKRRTVSLETCAEMTFDDPAKRTLWNEVMSLPAKYRLPLYLYYYEGYSAAEVGELLGLNVSTVQTRLARARAKLKSLLEEE